MAIPRTAHLTTLGVVIAVGLSCTIGASGAVAAPASVATSTPAPASSPDTTARSVQAGIPAPVVQRIDTDPNGTQRMLGSAGTDRVEVLDGDTVVTAWPGGSGLFSIAVPARFKDTPLTIVASRTVDGEVLRSAPVALPRTLQVDDVTKSVVRFVPGRHTFAGTATAGATITAKDADGTELFSTEVPTSKTAAGRWATEVDLSDEAHVVDFTQTVRGGATTTMRGVSFLPASDETIAPPTVDVVDRGVRGQFFVQGTVAGTAVVTVGDEEFTAEANVEGRFVVDVPARLVGRPATIAARTFSGTSTPVAVSLAAAPVDASIAAPTVRDVFNLPDGRIMVTGDPHAPGAIWFMHGDRVVAGTSPDGGFSYTIGSEYTDQQVDMATMQFGTISERTALPRLLSVDGVTDHENSFVPGPQTFTGRAEAGATVTARDADGTELFSVEASGAKAGVGSWSAEADLSAGSHELTFTQTTPDGRTSVMQDIGFTSEDDAPVAPVVVTAPAEGATVTSKRPVFEGTGAEGASVVVKGSSRQVATTTVADGKWSVPADFDLGNGEYRLWVTQTPTGGAAPTTVEVSFSVRHAAVAPVVVTGPTEGSTVTSRRPVFEGTGAEGATIVVKGSSRQVATTTVADGTWSVPADFDLGNGEYRLWVTQTPTGGAAPTTVEVSFTVRHAAVAPVVVTAPTEGSTVTSKRPVFEGTGAEGAQIVVKGSSRQVATTTVEDGTWSVPADFDLGNDEYRLWITQTPTGGGAPTTVDVTFRVAAG
ncbi:hypothetical protein DEI99_005860 [Curtobacterium sp. MCLR17_036]|uniref:hypothetical protein n=1 Tax=Curtobacterium sp. MCLR17_036 TaxID=2175620 RepID=UPI000DA84AEF|nr:hypothetical protein [Curtobacterium sp. MCLR17_036]WIE66060.1 hypothetical protein DEI99_005860 [Curtobacterium sp. MCLR17_036]